MTSPKSITTAEIERDVTRTTEAFLSIEGKIGESGLLWLYFKEFPAEPAPRGRDDKAA